MWGRCSNNVNQYSHNVTPYILHIVTQKVTTKNSLLTHLRHKLRPLISLMTLHLGCFMPRLNIMILVPDMVAILTWKSGQVYYREAQSWMREGGEVVKVSVFVAPVRLMKLVNWVESAMPCMLSNIFQFPHAILPPVYCVSLFNYVVTSSAATCQ